jgi:hypothetical protein
VTQDLIYALKEAYSQGLASLGSVSLDDAETKAHIFRFERSTDKIINLLKSIKDMDPDYIFSSEIITWIKKIEKQLFILRQRLENEKSLIQSVLSKTSSQGSIYKTP